MLGKPARCWGSSDGFLNQSPVPQTKKVSVYIYFIPIGRKRQRFETYEDSKTVDHLIEMIGKGQISVSGAISLSDTMVADGIPHQAVKAFSTLGTGSNFPMNGERDLHRWIKKLFGFCLRPYCVQVPLQDPWYG